MKTLIITLLNVCLLFVVACSNDNDKVNSAETNVEFQDAPFVDGCAGEAGFTKDLGKLKEKYSVTFKKPLKLSPNTTNKNFHGHFQAGRKYGCVVFATHYTKGELKGTYVAKNAQQWVSTCPGKNDYIYTQFYDKDGWATFRLQCEKAVYEDQLPQPFAPTFDDIDELDFDNKDGVKKTTKICTVVEPGSGETAVCHR